MSESCLLSFTIHSNRRPVYVWRFRSPLQRSRAETVFYLYPLLCPARITKTRAMAELRCWKWSFLSVSPERELGKQLPAQIVSNPFPFQPARLPENCARCPSRGNRSALGDARVFWLDPIIVISARRRAQRREYRR